MILFERPQEEAIGTPLWFTVDQNRKKYDLAFANFCFRSSVCGFFKALYSKNSICVDFRLFTYIYYTFFHFFSTLCSVVSVWLAFSRLYYLQKGIYVGEYWCFPNRLTTTTRFATNKISIMPLLFFLTRQIFGEFLVLLFKFSGNCYN